MSRPAWSLHAFELLLPDEQLDLFACREVRIHLLARQLELGAPVDRTLCGGVLPAQPQRLPLDRSWLRDRRLCAACREALEASRRGGPNGGWA